VYYYKLVSKNNSGFVHILILPIIIVVILAVLLLPFPQRDNTRVVCNFVPRDECPKYGLLHGWSLGDPLIIRLYKNSLKGTATESRRLNSEKSIEYDNTDWKTYKNKFGYELKYPPTWKVIKSTDAELIIASTDEGIEISNIVVPPKGHAAVYFGFIHSAVENYQPGKTEIKPNQNSADILIENGIFLDKSGSIGAQAYYWKSDPNIVDYENIFDQILSTFEFIDSSSTSKIVNLNIVPEIYQGIEWDNPKRVEGYEGEDITIYLDGDYHSQLQLKGTKWTKSLTDLSSEQRNEIYTSFESYFVDWLDQNGWNWRTKINDHVEIYAPNADGPSGEVYGQIGYDGKNIRLASWKTNTRYKSGEMPRTHACPCDMEMYYFLSDIIPVENIISQLDEK